VDSVSYDDATDFCQRLSWLTGRIVRLPTEKEFRAALGEVDGTEATLAAQVWSIENSNDTTHPVATSKPNAHGFHDLLGNVSEWLQAPDAAGTAKEIGGNYQTIREMLVAVPVGEIIKRDKSRLRGFRVLAETAAPPSVP
jgi:formylglycine-generating enzyme required for sulfatase activity